MTAFVTVPASTQPGLMDDINGLLSGYGWAAHAMTFAFPLSATAFKDYGSNPEPTAFAPLDAAEQAMVRKALASVSSVVDLSFTEVTGAHQGDATMLFGLSGAMPPLDDGRPSTGWGFYPGPLGSAGDVWFAPDRFGEALAGAADYKTVLHEIGHALGLKHGHEPKNGFAGLPSAHDSQEWSVMTYRSKVNGSAHSSTLEASSSPQSLMRDDIAALQHIYGANFSAQSSDTFYRFDETTGVMSINGVAQDSLAGPRIFRTIWDGGGNDTYDFSNFSKSARVDLRAGEGSIVDTALLAVLDASKLNPASASANVYNADLYQGDLRSLVENAIGGAGADTIVGNQVANVISGGGGDDWLSGADGADTLTGGDGADTLVGEAGDDVLDGGAGDDLLDGGSGFNTARYGFARSNYLVTLNLDGSLSVKGLGLAAGDGTDRLVDVGSLVFADGVVSASTFGWTPATVWTGTTDAENHVGTAGRDRIAGGGGRDTLSGGDGDDVFEVASGASKISGDAGFDTAVFSKNFADYRWTLNSALDLPGWIDVIDRSDAQASARLSNVELLRFADRDLRVFLGTQDANVLTGAGAADLLWGAYGDDTLDGGGGDDSLYGGGGDDVLRGGDGDDYLRGNAGDDTLDGGAGDNTVSYATAEQAITLDLGAGVATGQGADRLFNFKIVEGTAFNDQLRGDDEANILKGLDGNDTLAGGKGADTIDGGSGNNTVVFDGRYSDFTWSLNSNSTGDGWIEVTDNAGAVDIVSHVSVLQFDDRKQSILLGSANNDSITGTDEADIIWGAYGDDTLDGAAGNDSLYGGAGNDVIRGGDGDDSIRGNSGDDTLDGGAGRNTVSYGNATQGVIVDLAGGYALGQGEDVITNFSRVNGSIYGDKLRGDDSDNRFYGDKGDDVIDGRGGIDMAVFSGARANYDIRYDAFNKEWIVRDLRAGASSDGTDRLSNIEVLRFADGDDAIPTDIALTGGRVAENSVAGTLVATAAGVDADKGETFAYALRTSQGLPYDGPFVIDPATGAIRVAGNATLDYENRRFYDLVVRVTDHAGLYVDKAIRLLVDNVAGSETTKTPGLLTGTAEEDRLAGSSGADTLVGLAGADSLYGGAGADRLDGGGGADFLDGGVGADTMLGGAGDDIYVVDDLGDVIIETANGGRDKVVTSLAAYRLGAALENLAFTGKGAFAGTGNELGNAITGGAGADTLIGLAGADTLKGGAGDDSLDGGDGADVLNGGLGADTMRGGAGRDTFYVDNLGDVVADATAEDLVVISVANYDLAALRASGVRYVFDLALQQGQTSLAGGGGADTLTAAGSGTLHGGAGNDTYVVDENIVIVEAAGAGVDTVRTAARTYVLGDNLENLVSTGSGQFLGVGNALNNRITGGAGNDFLYGLDGDDTLLGGAGVDILQDDAGDDYLDGGAGADFMTGGAGKDVFVIDDLGDVTDATVGDIVIIRVRNYDLSKLDGASIHYQLTGISGGQQLFGLSGDDTLDGGLDADTLVGAAGNDSYFVDNVGDVVRETAGEGVDTVRTSLGAYTLGYAVERLAYAGQGDFAGTGNDLANEITGGGGADTLFGLDGDDTLRGGAGADTIWGGRGADQLWGGAGEDVFVFRADDAAGPAAGGRDWIRDFEAGDRIDLSRIAVETGVALHFDGRSLVAGHGSVAFDASTGMLSVDWTSDGKADLSIKVTGAGVTASNLMM